MRHVLSGAKARPDKPPGEPTHRQEYGRHDDCQCCRLPHLATRHIAPEQRAQHHVVHTAQEQGNGQLPEVDSQRPRPEGQGL